MSVIQLFFLLAPCLLLKYSIDEGMVGKSFIAVLRKSYMSSGLLSSFLLRIFCPICGKMLCHWPDFFDRLVVMGR